ncbi:MAG: putative glycosyl transferase [Methanocella sp. PtaU1.Bin125]|nr:MAG: putative glycosyl transferase [Methanocella sp. PtaU1.Bin125]
MRIAQVCPRYKPHIGGVETVVEEVSRRLAARGHDVTVITTDPTKSLPRQETVDGVRVVRFPAYAPGDAYYLSLQLRDYLKKASFDVVHAHSYHALPALSAASCNARRLVFNPYYHGKGHTTFRNLLLKTYRLPGARIFRRADAVVCNSAFERSLVCRDFPAHCGKVRVIPPGIDRKEFEGLTPFPKDEKVLLYAGRLEEYKGVQHALAALRHLDGWRMVVIGRGPYKSALVRQAGEESLKGRVTFLEGLARRDLLRWYATADVFVMLSGYESYGITVAEALTAGTPCVVARSSSLAEFADGGLCRGVDLPVRPERLAAEVLMAARVPYTKEIPDWDEAAARMLAVYAEGL